MSGVVDEDALSPKNRLKFLCSHGGRILPRPADGQLKYVGGEIRLLAVPRSLTFADLHDKVTATFGGPGLSLVIKYQVMPEDLGALVSVRNDDDLLHMLDEYDRHDHLPRSPTSGGAPLFRLFLFSSRATPLARSRSDSTTRQAFAISSGNSPTRSAADPGGGMHRVRSTPNLGGSQPGPPPPVGSPRYQLRHPPLHKYTAAFGVPHRHHHHHGGGGAHIMSGGGARYYYPITGQQRERWYYYPTPPGAGPAVGGRGCGCCGHVEESGGVRSGTSYSYAHMPPRANPAMD